MHRLLTPFARLETYRALLYYLVGLVIGSLGLAALIAVWSVTLVFAITPLVFPLLFGLRWGVGQLARAQAALARELLGAEAGAAVTYTGVSFWSRSLNVLRDGAFWRQQTHILALWAIALIPIALLSNALQLLALPLWYRWAPGADVFGFTDIDTFSETLPLFAIGVGLLVLAIYAASGSTPLSRGLASRLLRGTTGGPVRSPAEARARRLAGLTISALIATGLVALLVVIWALTWTGYFWPVWPMISLALVVGTPGWIVLVLERPDITRFTLGSQALAMQIGISAVLFGFLVAVWTLTGAGYFWPMWAGLGLALLAAAHAAVIHFRRELHRLHRIEELEESRAGAVDVQESELRRIERDLHDGAQARLVSLGMSIGMAEEKLRTDPEGARALLAEARTDARRALEELRDLARGIRPPILTDRGLEAAIEALVARSPVPVSLHVDVPERPTGAVETATYFVVAEALANAIKYANATEIGVTVRRANGLLVAEVRDDGRGGADPGGNGLRGLRQRVGALDGTLRVASPAGGPTTVRAELPCA